MKVKLTKILLLAPQNTVGGIATWAKILLKYSDSSRVRYKVIDTTKRYDALGKKLRFRGAFLGFVDAAKRLFRISEALITFRPDIIHINSSPSIGLFARDVPLLFFLSLLNFKTVIHLHGGKIDGFLGNNKIREYITKLAFNSASAIFVITRDIEVVLREKKRSLKVIYVPNMIDDDYVSHKRQKNTLESSGKTKIINVAWQAPEKGSLDLVDAIKYSKSDIDCDLIGTVADENKIKIESKIKELGLQNKVRLTGPKFGKELLDSYTNADILTFPSHFEGFPMVILEAMSHGLPIIASDVGNIREMIGFGTDDPAGLLLKNLNPINTEELAALIDKVIADPELRKSLGSNGYKRIMKYYRASEIVPRLEELLFHIARERILDKGFIGKLFEQRY